MGIIYEKDDNNWIEAREKSIKFGLQGGVFCVPNSDDISDIFEIDYEDLDVLEELVKMAQEKRRDGEKKQ